MDVDLAEIRDYIAARPPFDQLPPKVLDRLSKQVSVRRLPRGTTFPPPDAGTPSLYLLRRGGVEMCNAQGTQVSKLGEGDICVFPCDSRRPEAQLTGTTTERTLVYLLPCALLNNLRGEHRRFAEDIDRSVAERLRQALRQMHAGSLDGTRLMTLYVGELLTRDLVQASPDTTIRQAAALMTEQRVSSLVIVDGSRLAGIVTDRDLRSRCIVPGLPCNQPVRKIMTERIHTTTWETLGSQALITMSRLNIHHLPVLHGDQVVGVVSTTDLARFQSSNAVYLVSDIRKAPDVDTLVQASRQLPELQIHLANSGATADHIGEAITAVTDAISIRLLELAEAKLGTPPVAYLWMAGGSHARREQTSHSDQDNALMMADDLTPADEPYFEALARFVNEGLNACGYYYCPGEVMASNPQWRQPLKTWRKYFKGWIDKPEPKALMLSSVFFDLRAIHGTFDLLDDELRPYVLKRAHGNKIFLAYMAANALNRRPPIGFFRNFVLISGGDHDGTFDAKIRGIVPIVDLARVAALSARIEEVNTVERLERAAETKALSKPGTADLIVALEFIATLRIRHQVDQLKRGKKPDNFISPDEISALERSHLKDAFALIDTMQQFLAQRYQTGHLS